MKDDVKDKAFARHTDPKTSREAARAISGKRVTQLQMHFLRACAKVADGRLLTKVTDNAVLRCEPEEGLTNRDVTNVSGVAWERITPRGKPLREMGAIEYVYGSDGEIVTRKPTLDDHNQSTFRITAYGRKLLETGIHP